MSVPGDPHELEAFFVCVWTTRPVRAKMVACRGRIRVCRGFLCRRTNLTLRRASRALPQQRQMSVLQKVKVNEVEVPEGVTKYDLYKVNRVLVKVMLPVSRGCSRWRS